MPGLLGSLKTKCPVLNLTVKMGARTLRVTAPGKRRLHLSPGAIGGKLMPFVGRDDGPQHSAGVHQVWTLRGLALPRRTAQAWYAAQGFRSGNRRLTHSAREPGTNCQPRGAPTEALARYEFWGFLPWAERGGQSAARSAWRLSPAMATGSLARSKERSQPSVLLTLQCKTHRRGRRPRKMEQSLGAKSQ